MFPVPGQRRIRASFQLSVLGCQLSAFDAGTGRLRSGHLRTANRQLRTQHPSPLRRLKEIHAEDGNQGLQRVPEAGLHGDQIVGDWQQGERPGEQPSPGDALSQGERQPEQPAQAQEPVVHLARQLDEPALLGRVGDAGPEEEDAMPGHVQKELAVAGELHPGMLSALAQVLEFAQSDVAAELGACSVEGVQGERVAPGKAHVLVLQRLVERRAEVVP